MLLIGKYFIINCFNGFINTKWVVKKDSELGVSLNHLWAAIRVGKLICIISRLNKEWYTTQHGRIYHQSMALDFDVIPKSL